MRFLLLFLLVFLALVVGCAMFQRRLLYYPTHHQEHHGLSEWRHGSQLIGFVREVPEPENVWLMLHGNGGQASDRAFVLSSFSDRDSVFILEYPGYGSRPGTPSMKSFNSAAIHAYERLRSKFRNTPVCVVGESIGSGPAAVLATNPHPPDKIVLITPFDILARVAAHHMPILPTSLILKDNWNNIASLKGYQGPLEIFGAREDTIIPIVHAKALAESKPSARFHVIDEGHNEWAVKGRVAIRND